MLVPCCLDCVQVPSTGLVKALSEPAEMSTPGATMSGLTLRDGAVVAVAGSWWWWLWWLLAAGCGCGCGCGCGGCWRLVVVVAVVA